MLEIKCDRCGRNITEHRENVGYILTGINNDPFCLPEDGKFEIELAEFNDKHFCINCLNEIRAFVAAPDLYQRKTAEEQTTDLPKDISSEDETQKKQMEEPAKDIPNNAQPKDDMPPDMSKRHRIDIGKIMALKNAGWSVGQIADEMGMQPQAVSNAIYQYKKKLEKQKENG